MSANWELERIHPINNTLRVDRAYRAVATDELGCAVFGQMNGVKVRKMRWLGTASVDKEYRSMVVYVDKKEEANRLLAKQTVEMANGECAFTRPFVQGLQPARCYRCHLYGHLHYRCKAPVPMCGQCAQPGHFASGCTSDVFKCAACPSNHGRNGTSSSSSSSTTHNPSITPTTSSSTTQPATRYDTINETIRPATQNERNGSFYAAPMANAPRHVKDSLKQIDENSWLVGETLILRRNISAEKFLGKDSQTGHYYTICEAPAAIAAKEVPSDSHIRLIHQGAHISAVWSLGDVFLKVKLLQDRSQATPESVTLNWLATKKIGFNIPRALYYKKEDDRSFLFFSRVPGVTLASAWQGLSQDAKQDYVTCIANICKQMSKLTSHTISGVDGGQLPDPRLAYCTPSDYRSDTLQKNCKYLGMDISADSTFRSFHNDLAPGNILVDPESQVGIIDWEMAGYVPYEWIRTKFEVGPEVTGAWKTWSRKRFPPV
ncbi:hypothetical protein S40288_09886 [Stachybotrys chartarum IBT 40288]|nr:hypothetical protein S40288_09886 [Stachybotrys chartarum IBT 40288]